MTPTVVTPRAKEIKYDYEVHPLAKLFPPLPDDEFEKLKKDIAARGQEDPIVLSADGKTLLDGRNRLRACKELGIEPWTQLFAESSEQADLIWSRNMLRRHLTADQRAAIAHKWSDTERQAAKQRQLDTLKHGATPGKPRGGGNATTGKTRKAIAQKARVSEHEVRQAETVAKHAPELLREVETGQVMLKDAAKIASAKNRKKRKPKTVDTPWKADLNLAFGRIRDCVFEEYEKVPSEHKRFFRRFVVDRMATWAYDLDQKEDDEK